MIRHGKLMIFIVIALVVLATVAADAASPVADSSTLDGKIICGYQGWFCCPGDGNDPKVGWRHWSRNQVSIGPGLYNTDIWPDTSDYDPADLFEVPNTTLKSGKTAYLFSAAKQGVVNVHFRIMRDYGIDGVLLERFTNGDELVPGSAYYKQKNIVLGNVQSAAKRYGRVWSVEYDITGDRGTDTIYQRITDDWKYLRKTYRVHKDRSYLRHDGKLVVMIFGIGFKGDSYPVDPALAIRLIDYFKKEGCWVLGGVPWGWRTLTGGSKTEPEWAKTFRSFNGVKPWTVGAYKNLSQITYYRDNVWKPDLAECDRLGMTYMPTVWPRFGWDNMHDYECGRSKMSPRGGQHLWDQLFVMRSVGVRTVFGAMFDEYDESTAMMKMSDDVPTTGCWWTNEGMPADWHLRLLREGRKMLRGEIALSWKIPISP